MAKINGKGMVSGTAGSVVYRNYRGMNIIQGKPRKFKQTAESIRAATEFGLSSSTAAVIRSAFEPAYLHRDGEAAARSTQLIYRSIRNSLTGTVGQRDLHDGDLSVLSGMEFNTRSKLSEVFQVSHQITRDGQGRVVVSLAAIAARRDIRLPGWLDKTASKYKIRFSLIGFNFRKEYYEYLEFRDISIGKYEESAAQQIIFSTNPPRDQILLLSMTLMVYKGNSKAGEEVLLNSREFSPCALIGAFAAEDAGDLPGQALDQTMEEIPEERWPNVVLIGYEGNHLLRRLQARTKQQPKLPEIKRPPQQTAEGELTGKRVSFRKA